MENTNTVIKELELSTIRHNEALSIAIIARDVERCAKTIRQYGLLTPLIVRPCDNGGYLVIDGECELKALQEVGLKKTEAVIVNCQDSTEADKLSLLLSSLKQDPTPLSEGLILQNLFNTGSYTQADIAHMVGKSVSWVSKRLTLIERLNKSVLELVISKKISCHTAQEIARLPDEVQLNFATKVVRDGISKSKVEKLVVAYNNPEIPDSLRVNILENPLGALDLLPRLMLEIGKVRKNKKKKPSPTDEDKIYNALRLMIKVINEIELNLAGIEEGIKSKQILGYLQKAGEYALRFYKLVNYNKEKHIFPGENHNSGGEDCDHKHRAL